MELVRYPTLADSICDLRSRKIKRTFLTQSNILLDGQPIIEVLKTHYEINRQLEAHKIIVKTGTIINTSVIDTLLKPKGITNHKVTEDRKDEQEVEITKDYAASVDKDASWLKKGGKYRFGYKKHHVTDNEGLVLGVLTTKASTNEIVNLEDVFDTADLTKDIPLKADKGYHQGKISRDTKKERNEKPHFNKGI